ncbi:plasmid partitioning protein [Serratia entomophila]|uniref:ParB/RepB/Spo0J family partition protein n=1 Tax=Serratia TaxID=613 RepID=UPI001F4BF489|nr:MULTISPECIES: ParB/RepB/Spo0J family partition protein [Serratia]ULG11279.1 ParC [Serratia entomophila]ULG19089.1 ParC [Serratia proteamaculans]CAI1184721.1 plasmid partitioning protein [Serratia entomophila]CAI2153929.1 plasmid partitioning protein [Serratia entomophila]
MSNIESTVPAKGKTTRPAKSSKKNALAEKIEAALAKAVRKTATLGQMVLTDLNVRKKKSSQASIEGLAASIRSAGLLMNLVVYEMDDGRYGVAAGERRTLALRWLQGLNKDADKTTPDGVVTDDYPVEVLIVSKAMARVVSMMENSQREQMHPADQVTAFRDLSADGQTPAQIGDLLGFSTRHVQRCLRLATMAPVLLDALADDKITLDQLQALSATEDHQRQCDVWVNAHGWAAAPQHLREAVLKDEVSAKDNSQLAFVGREAYESAGGTFKFDLFTDEGFLTEPALLERLTREKLHALAEQVAGDEGWSWAEGRISAIKTWGEDAELYREMAEPVPEFSDDELAEITRLKARFAALEAAFEEADADTDTDVMIAESDAVQADIERITEQATIRSWPQAMRSTGGVMVSLRGGDVVYQRGIVLRASEAPAGDDSGDGTVTTTETAPKTKEKGLSAALITCLSSERSLAVMGALVENPTVALALHTHTLAVKVFGSRYAGSLLKTDLIPKRAELLTKAPTAEGSRADRKLGELHAQWESKLPPEWNTDFTWLLTWEQADVVALLAYCVGQSLDAIQLWPERDGKVGGELTPLEHALDFNLRDWWQPTKANYFGRISKELMSDALVDAGKVAQAASVLKMKKGDAAQLAEDELSASGWVPDCLLPASDEADAADDIAHPDNVAA